MIRKLFISLIQNKYTNLNTYLEWLYTNVYFYKKPLNFYLKRLVRFPGAIRNPEYGYCIFKAAILAKELGIKKISILEFGVAGGNGLLSIEEHCSYIKKLIGIEFEVFGFDLEGGLPAPKDYRDSPYLFTEGSFVMNKKILLEKLKFSKLIIGDVGETLDSFFEINNPSPIGAILFDLDFYTSTKKAFKVFLNKEDKYYLPRIHCNFDDVQTIESIGERLAIKEFNEEHKYKKIENSYRTVKEGIKNRHRIFEFHNFKHKDYSTPLDKIRQDHLKGTQAEIQEKLNDDEVKIY